MSSCSSNNYVINTAASYCASSADCTRSSNHQTGNTRNHNHPIRPYPDIITHNVDVNINKKPEVSSGMTDNKQTQKPQYASVDKQRPKKLKHYPPNEQPLISIVKHKDPHQQQQQQPDLHSQPPQAQQQTEITYQKINTSSSHQYPRHNKNELNSSMPKTIPKVDIIKTTYPDL